MTSLAPDFARISIERLETAGLDNTTLLNAAERIRLEAISHPVRRRQFVAGRVVTRKLLSTLSQDSALDWSLDLSATGKPVLRHRPDVHLSISHSGEWVACAIASVPVGLDIERIEPNRSTDELIKQVCSDEEQSLLQSLPGARRERLFTELWTLKEAWLKRLGAALDVARMRTLRWTPVNPPVGNCASWMTPDGLSVSVLGPPAQSFLSDAPALVREAHCTTRQVEDA